MIRDKCYQTPTPVFLIMYKGLPDLLSMLYHIKIYKYKYNHNCTIVGLVILLIYFDIEPPDIHN